MSQLQENQLFAERYRLVKKLGSGAFSEVWKAEDTKAGNLVVAIKIYAPDKGMDEDGIAIFSQEYAIVFNVTHQNLLRPNYFDNNNGSPFLVLPYCSKGSVLKMLGTNPSEQELLTLLRDVASGLAYLHSQNPPIIHQDIKPDNILITERGEYKLTDFGISTRIRSTLRRSVGNTSNAGTMAYMAPERFERNPAPIMASDIWSLGATLFELMTDDAPFGNLGGVSLKSGAEIPEVGGNYSNEFKQLVEACLAKDPWDRPTAEQLKEYAEKVLKGETPKAPWQSEVQEHHSSSQDSGRPTQRIISSSTQENDFGRTTQRKSAQEQIVREPEQQTNVAKNKNTKLLWLCGTLVIVVAIVVGGWLINNQIERKNERIAQEQKIEQERIAQEQKIEQERIAKEQERQRKAEQERIAQEQERQRKAEQERQRKAEQERQRKAEQERIAELQTITVNGVTFEMVYVKGGTFTMGCTDEQGSDCDSDEKPTHRVTLSDYMIGKYEVTQELWHAVMGNNPSFFKGNNLPIESVSWNDAQEFLTKLNQKTGRRFRLPTEAEWEFAARGGNKSKGYKYSGSNTLGNVAWNPDNSGSKTHPVGQKTLNELGIYDMSGNVWEWCQDWYGSYSSGSQTNPTGPSSGSYRVLRGGSWYFTARLCRVSNRNFNTPDDRSSYSGFRVVLLP